MREIDKILQQLEQDIRGGKYRHIEADKLELKDLSSGLGWDELYKTICSFLNTRGGIVIIGVREDTKLKQYKFTGFDLANSDKLKEITNQYVDNSGVPFDVTEYVRRDLIEVIRFLDGNICLLFVEKLPEEKKYIKWKKNRIAYERQIDGDHKISLNKIKAQEELKSELQKARELQFVPNSTMADLDVDKLNEYIVRLNKDVKVETLKADIQQSLSFLTRKRFVREGSPTLLGMLVCGKYIYDFVGGRCQLDCYVNTGSEIADEKKVLKENIVQLMESGIAFVFSNISTGISVEKGGTTTFEFPERVIRETINNALTHRDYSSDRFTNITIVPHKYIEIRNAGKFRQEQILRIDKNIPVRRIIPIPKAQNPNLADVLKSYDRWEGKGWGMSSLINFALENAIDVPYYRLYSENEIGLIIQKGQTLDDEMKSWIFGFSRYILNKTNGRELTSEQQTVLAFFYKSELLNLLERYTVLLTPDNNHFQVIKDLETYGLVEKHTHSPELYPVYSVDRTLTKKDFVSELRDIYGGDYDGLNEEFKAVLDTIYLFNEYALVKIVNANLVGKYLYLKKHKVVTDTKNYDTFMRRIRNKILTLEKNGYIVKKNEKKDYLINKGYKRKPSLFDKP
ncbi:MAG: hypothetical protein EPO24_13570 [Bacteroidetes bacterium]|nr:MAG: hypothetical protein EPO24_13570 [Bacteroidota bacterium]